MATLLDIETEVLLQCGEDPADPAVFDGSDELRAGIADAIDELSMYGGFFQEKLQLKLQANVGFYSFSMPNHWPLYITRARLVEYNRDLDCETFVGLADQAPMWLISRGSPYKYVPFGPTTVVIWPCYAEDGGIVELDVVCVPKVYGSSDLYLSIGQKFELALIAYGRYVVLLKGGDFEGAMAAFRDYLEFGGMIKLFTTHQRKAEVRRLDVDKST